MFYCFGSHSYNGKPTLLLQATPSFSIGCNTVLPECSDVQYTLLPQNPQLEGWMLLYPIIPQNSPEIFESTSSSIYPITPNQLVKNRRTNARGFLFNRGVIEQLKKPPSPRASLEFHLTPPRCRSAAPLMQSLRNICGVKVFQLEVDELAFANGVPSVA